MFFNPHFLLWLAGGLLAYKYFKKDSQDSKAAGTAQKRSPAQKGSPAQKRGSAEGQARPSSKPDDLTEIPGIGAKVEASLNEAGISTFDQLAKANEGRLRSHFEGKPGYRLMNPGLWIAEAKKRSARR